MKKQIIILGGGGHASVLIEMVMFAHTFEIAGILDPNRRVGENIQGIQVLGDESLLISLCERGVSNACIGVGSVKSNGRRKVLYEKVKECNFVIPSLFHPKAIISINAIISEGVQIMAGAIIQTGTSIGENTIINSGAIVEHDCIIGRHVHICPAAVILGNCTVEEGAFVGAGSVVRQGTRIGRNSITGAGSVVVADVPDGVLVKGVPAA